MKKIFLLAFGTLFSIQFALAQVEYNATGGGNFFTLAYPANVTSLTPGLSFTFKANHTITGSATLNVNGLGNVTIKKEVTQDLVASDILSGQIVTVVYDGTNFQMTSNSGSGGGGTSLWTESGADTYLTTTTNEVGIGTTSPATKLDIQMGATYFNGGLNIQNINSSNSAQMINVLTDGNGNGVNVSMTGFGRAGFFDIGNTGSSAAAITGRTNGTGKAIEAIHLGSEDNSTKYGVWSDVSGGGINSENVAGYFTAAGGTNNYGLIVDQGNVGIGTTSPAEGLTLEDVLIMMAPIPLPGVTTDRLYNVSGDLFWDGVQLNQAVGNSILIEDADGDTEINVEAAADQDVIHFSLGDNAGYPGAEYFTMIGPRLEVINSGASIFIGSGAGANEDLSNRENIFIGENSGQATISGASNVAVGSYALELNTTGSENVAIGGITMGSNTTGQMNTAVGDFTLGSNETGSENVAVGKSALDLNVSGNWNTALGKEALQNNEASDNTALGYISGSNTSTGFENTFVGARSGLGNTTGSYNTVVGAGAGNFNQTGSDNVFIGYNAETSADGLQNATAIGANAQVGASNSLVLGSINGVNGATSNTNIGIGTTTPTALLTLEGDNDDVDHTSNSTAGSGSADYNFKRTNGGGVVANGNRLGALRFYGEETVGSQKLSAMIAVHVDGAPAASDVPASIRFSTQEAGNTGNPTEKMRLTSDGDLGIGTTNPAYKLDVNGDIGISSDDYRVVRVDEGADLVPVAYGVLDTESSPGTIAATTAATSTSNYTTEYLGPGEYKIVYTGTRNFSGLGEAHVTITPYGMNPVFASYQITGSKEFTIRLFDQGGSPVDTNVSFTLRIK